MKGIGYGAIARSGVKELRIPKSVEWLMVGSLGYCTELETVRIDAPLEVVPYGCFLNDTKLSNVVLSDSIANVGPYAFSGCTALENIVLPSSLGYVDALVFDGCQSLASIQCNALTPPATSYYAFDESLYTQAKLLVPEQSLNAYKTAETWKNFLTIGGISTKIDGIGVDQTTKSLRIYDLLGRQRNEQTKGLIIVNGKKTVRN